MFGGASLYVNGDTNVQTNYVTIAAGGEDFTFPGDFTVDWWHYVVAYTDTWGGHVTIYSGDTSDEGLTGLGWGNGGVNSQFHYGQPHTFISSPSTGSWHHFAITRADTTYRAFVDGALVVEQADVSLALGGSIARITGSGPNSDNGDFNGYIDELRVVKGTAVWTADFTPPTAPY